MILWPRGRTFSQKISELCSFGNLPKRVQQQQQQRLAADSCQEGHQLAITAPVANDPIRMAAHPHPEARRQRSPLFFERCAPMRLIPSQTFAAASGFVHCTTIGPRKPGRRASNLFEAATNNSVGVEHGSPTMIVKRQSADGTEERTHRLRAIYNNLTRSLRLGFSPNVSGFPGEGFLLSLNPLFINRQPSRGKLHPPSEGEPLLTAFGNFAIRVSSAGPQ